MFNTTIIGIPQKCLNRLCGHPFYRESHQGWEAKNETEAIAVMHCSRCGDKFACVQPYSIVHDYKAKLPPDPNRIKKSRGPITEAELERIQERLKSNSNPLQSLTHDYSSPPGNLE